MKIEHPALLRFIGWGGAGLLRRWIGTIRVDVRCEAPEADPRTATRGFVYCLWHETMLLPAVVFADRGIRILISQHNDGEYIARIVRRLGFAVVRGSSTRGAVRAVREMARSAGLGNLAITPDGPKGPREELQNGAVFLASRRAGDRPPGIRLRAAVAGRELGPLRAPEAVHARLVLRRRADRRAPRGRRGRAGGEPPPRRRRDGPGGGPGRAHAGRGDGRDATPPYNPRPRPRGPGRRD